MNGWMERVRTNSCNKQEPAILLMPPHKHFCNPEREGEDAVTLFYSFGSVHLFPSQTPHSVPSVTLQTKRILVQPNEQIVCLGILCAVCISQIPFSIASSFFFSLSLDAILRSWNIYNMHIKKVCCLSQPRTCILDNMHKASRRLHHITLHPSL